MRLFIFCACFAMLIPSGLSYSSAESEVPIAVSGDLSGFRESRHLLYPRGGLIGLLDQIEKVQPGPGGIRLLTGNNLGREVRALIEASARPRVRKTAEGSRKYFKLRLEELESQFPGQLASPHCADAQSRIEDGYNDIPADTRPIANLLEKCENDLIRQRLSRNFTAIALGEGDFNAISLETRAEGRPRLKTRAFPDGIRILRDGPFLSNNLYLVRREVEEDFQNSSFRVALDEGLSSQAPYEALSIELMKGIEPKAGAVVIKPVERQPEWIFTLHFEKGNIDRAESRWMLEGGEVKVVHKLDSKTTLDDRSLSIDFLTMQPPLPLLPNMSYEIYLKLDGSISASIRVPTFESFTRADSSGEFGEENSWGKWTRGGIPVIEPRGLPGQVQILSVLDAATEQRLDLRQMDCDSNASTTDECALRFAPVADSILYWQKVLEYLHLRRAAARFREYAGKKFANPPAGLSEVLSLSKELKERLRKSERDAWKRIEAWIDAKDPADPLELDWRISSIGEALKASAAKAALIVLAQTSWESVDELAREIDGVALWVGGAAEEEMIIPPAYLDGPTRGLKVITSQFGEEVGFLTAKFEAKPDWGICTLASRVSQVPGEAPQIVWAEGNAPEDAHSLSPHDPLGARLAKIIERALPTGKSQSDNDHFYNLILEAARRGANAEAAVLDEGILATEPLRWLRFLQRLREPVRIRLDANIEQLMQIPGIQDEDARILLRDQIDSPAKLKEYLAFRYGTEDVFQLARWFAEGTGPSGDPRIYQPGLEWLLLTRIAFTKDKLTRVTVTEDVLAEIAAVIDGDEFIQVGLSEVGPENDPALHLLPLKGKRPTVSAFPSRTGRRKGKIPQLDSDVAQFEDTWSSHSCIPNGEGPTLVTLRELVCRWILDESLRPAKLNEAIEESDGHPWWTLDVTQIDLGFSKTELNDDFESLAQESRTQSADQRELTLNPQFRLGLYFPDGLSPFGGTTDWTTTGLIRFRETRVSEPGEMEESISQANDQWSIRTQLDFYEVNRRHALFTALDFRHQLKAKFATFSFMDSMEMQVDVEHGIPRDKEINFETGYLYSNGDDLQFQIGASISHNLERQTRVFLVNDDMQVAMENLGKVLDGLDRRAITPLTGSGTDYGLAFSAEWSHEFFKREDGPDWSFSTKLTEGNLFFGGTGVETFRPQLRFLWTNELSIPLFGNLFLVPSLEHYFLRISAQDAGTGPRNFNQLTTELKFRYALDIKPMFQRLKNAFSFRNRPDAK